MSFRSILLCLLVKWTRWSVSCCGWRFITKNDAKWKQGGMTVVPEGATVVDIGLVQVYAWHERTVGTKNQSSDHFVFRVAGDVCHLIRSTKGTTTNVQLTCGRTA